MGWFRSISSSIAFAVSSSSGSSSSSKKEEPERQGFSDFDQYMKNLQDFDPEAELAKKEAESQGAKFTTAKKELNRPIKK